MFLKVFVVPLLYLGKEKGTPITEVPLFIRSERGARSPDLRVMNPTL